MGRHPVDGAKTRFALVDCNNFFCSCERVFNPALMEKPVVVLSNNDGCIISRSQEAKALGIPMGAPLHEQREVIRKHGVEVFSSNHTLYGDMSARVMSILRDEVPAIEVYSIDEAFLLLPEGFTVETACALRAKVLRWTGIPVCIGIGSTKLLAKAANSHAKKNKAAGGGVFDLTGYRDPDGILAGMETGDLWGVGRNLSRRLQAMGITTALEFKQADPSAIRKSMGVVGERMLRELNGIPCLELEETSPDRKGVMASRSFGSPVESLEELEEALANHVARASEKIRRHGLLVTRLEVFLQTNRFSPGEPRHFPSAGESLQRPTASTAELITAALALLGSIHRPGYRYKKTGIHLTGLVQGKNHQPCLELEPVKPSRRIDVDAIVDAINARLGDPRHPVITRAAMGTLSSKKTWVMKSSLRSPRYTTSLKELPVVRA